ncbi:MAG: serine/threonine protein kinase [Polyangiaceae bacterium]|nr:serine/threonine protein kinase [Polyangiaceae bacterium]
MLGKGGMGEVYEGENERIRRRVAIKVLHSEASQQADLVQRFEREAQAAGRIGSPHIVEVLDLGCLVAGERFMVMEYLDGESLGARIKSRQRLSPHELAPILHALLEGLASAHDAHIIHRDLKHNVFLVKTKTQNDFVKILDFGVLFGTLFIAVCALLVYTFFFDQPTAVVAAPPPLPSQAAASAAPKNVADAAPGNSADAAPFPSAKSASDSTPM